MNQLCITFAVWSIFIAHTCGGQIFTGSARHAGLGFAALSIHDPFSLFDNPAGITDLSGKQIGFHYNTFYHTAGIRHSSFTAIYPMKKLSLGGGLSLLGNEVRRDVNLSTSIADKIGNTSLGLRADWKQLSTEGYGTHNYLILSFGGITQITKEIFFAGYVYNLTQAGTRNFQRQVLPVCLKAELSFRPGKKIIINFQTSKEVRKKTGFCSGLEYSINEYFKARTGFSTNPFSVSAGTAFIRKSGEINYAIITNSRLGSSHYINLIFKFGKK